jgi:hypothetical protein
MLIRARNNDKIFILIGEARSKQVLRNTAL